MGGPPALLGCRSSRDFEDQTSVVDAASQRCAVQVAGGIADQAAYGAAAGASAVEGVKNSFLPAMRCVRELEDGSKGDAAFIGGAVEMAGGVQNGRVPRGGSVCTTGEVVQNRFLPALVWLLREFEYVAGAERTAIHGGAVEIPSGVENDASLRFRSVGSAGEGVNHVLDPFSSGSRRQLEHNPEVVFASCSRCAVEICGAVEGHAGPRRASVCAGEVVQYMLGPLPRRELQ